jgi:hypothetical protein
MSFEEKGTWLYAVIGAVLPVVYFTTILRQLPTVPVAEIDYQGQLLWVVGAAIVLSIVGMIGIGILSPNDAGKADQRDKDVNRFGEYVGGIVLGVGMIVPFGLAMAEAQHFWIANAMYLAFVVGTLTGTAVKLVAYRRGF